MLWSRSDLPPVLGEYRDMAKEFDQRRGNLEAAPRFYPGSPWFARLLLRVQDRLALCEMHPEEYDALRSEFQLIERVSVQEIDGYTAIRGMLPPPERRALVLIDPPFEAQDEFAQIAAALAEGLRRFASGVFAVWYPLTERARIEEFFRAVRELNPPPTLAAELAVAGEFAPMKMKGCGLLVVNPPWQFDTEAEELLAFLATALAQAPGGGGRVEWIVREG